MQQSKSDQISTPEILTRTTFRLLLAKFEECAIFIIVPPMYNT